MTEYTQRFRFILGALGGVALGALTATAILLAGRDPATDGVAWSTWKPQNPSIDGGAQEIADHVAPQYRQNKRQLVLVKGGPLVVADLPARIAIQNLAGENQGDISFVGGDGVLYNLCGLGKQCAIAGGKPSNDRFLTLQREALELALYSFRYLKGVDNVVALMPPAPGKKAENALFFRRDDVAPALERPLEATLPLPAPPIAALPDLPEANLVTRFTAGKLFTYAFQQGQDLSAFVVLSPVISEINQGGGRIPDFTQTVPGPTGAAGATGASGSRSAEPEAQDLTGAGS